MGLAPRLSPPPGQPDPSSTATTALLPTVDRAQLLPGRSASPPPVWRPRPSRIWPGTVGPLCPRLTPTRRPRLRRGSAPAPLSSGLGPTRPCLRLPWRSGSPARSAPHCARPRPLCRLGPPADLILVFKFGLIH